MAEFYNSLCSKSGSDSESSENEPLTFVVTPSPILRVQVWRAYCLTGSDSLCSSACVCSVCACELPAPACQCHCSQLSVLPVFIGEYKGGGCAKISFQREPGSKASSVSEPENCRALEVGTPRRTPSCEACGPSWVRRKQATICASLVATVGWAVAQ